jgi:hypothetical protein
VVVHDREVFLPRVDEWTGEKFDTEPFLIPVLGNDEVKWAGCYCCPSTALAAIYDSMKNEERSEYLNCAVDDFQASLVRKPSANDTDSFVITVAPHWTRLDTWGGNITLDDYHREIKYSTQLQLFSQQLPQWKCPPEYQDAYKVSVSVVSRAQSGYEVVEHLQAPVDVPRCCAEFLEWVRQQGIFSVRNPNVFTVSTDPMCPGSFAISPDSCSQSDLASSLMHDYNVFGRTVHLFRSIDAQALCSSTPPNLNSGIPSAHLMQTAMSPDSA